MLASPRGAAIEASQAGRIQDLHGLVWEAVLMRVAMMSALKARDTTRNLGFRCARDPAGAEGARVLVLLDPEGRVLASTERLGAVPDPAFLAKVKAAVTAPVEPPAG